LTLSMQNPSVIGLQATANHCTIVISDNYNSRLTTVKIPVFLRGLIDYSGQGGPDGHRSTSEEINGDTKQGKN
jgi:hypothetical protein